jgi:chromosome segregation ATPase
MNQSNFYHIPPAPVSYQLPFGMQQQTNPAEAPTIQEPTLLSKSTMTNQQADRDTQTDQPAKSSAFNPTSEEMGKLPIQFQTWAQSLLDERKVLKEQNAELRLKSDELFERSQEIETELAQLVENMRKTDEVNCKLRFELEQATTRANTAERDLLLERTKLQQLKLDIEDADGNAASLTKKYAEKSSQLDSARQRCAELEKNVASLENQMAGVHGQLRGLQVSCYYC